MTWLLHKIQKVLGSLTGRKSGSQVSESTQLGSEIASRLQSSNAVRSDDPVAVRVQGSSLTPVSPTQSTAPLRQKNASVLKDAVDPVAAAPDTHQRLDAAPASLPGGPLEAPSFPTNVSDLLSSQPSAPSALNGDVLDSITVTGSESTTKDEQLPDIHDLLPAVEPDPPSDISDESALSSSDADAPLAEGLSDADDAAISSSPVVESAQRVSASEQATLFSFDIVETDVNVEGDLAERDAVEDDFAEDATISSAAAVDQSLTVDLPIVGSLIPDTLLNDLSARTNGDQSEPDIADVDPTDTKTDTNPVEAEALSASAALLEKPSAEVQNPWLTAVPPQQKERVEATPQESITKNGTVKLLFKLKAGNFHGYITPDDGTKDILFHQKYINANIFEHIDRGTPVVVTAEYKEGKAYATRVDLLQK